MSNLSPHIIEFPTIHNKDSFLSVSQFDEHLPFVPVRLYWSYGHSDESIHGNHYHPDSDRVIVCMSGHIQITIEDLAGRSFCYELNDPSQGVYIPKNHWVVLKMSHQAILLAFASTNYRKGESIDDYSDFDKLRYA